MDERTTKRIEILKAELAALREEDQRYWQIVHPSLLARQEHEKRVEQVQDILAALAAMMKK